jgi:hypothetical protein
MSPLCAGLACGRGLIFGGRAANGSAFRRRRFLYRLGRRCGRAGSLACGAWCRRRRLRYGLFLQTGAKRLYEVNDLRAGLLDGGRGGDLVARDLLVNFGENSLLLLVLVRGGIVPVDAVLLDQLLGEL